MPRRPLNPGELQIGQPLTRDAHDERGLLMMREGHLITTENQIEWLLRMGRVEDDGTPDADTPEIEYSPLGRVMQARQRLQALLHEPPAATFAAGIEYIAGLLREACERNADVALASILLCRDCPYAIRHAVNVAIACEVVGKAMNLPPQELACTMAAALTMNLGMLDLQYELQAVDTPLPAAQQAAIHRHCERSVMMLRERGISDPQWLQTVLDHHERPDGSGYPAGKTGGAISVHAKLLALADVYCARVSGRQYRPPLQPNIALRWLFLKEGSAVDETLAAVFIKTLGIYPPGTSVRLRSGSIAVVTHRGPSSNAPRVAAITTQDGRRVSVPVPRRCEVEAYAVTEVVDLGALQLSVEMESIWGDDAAG